MKVIGKLSIPVFIFLFLFFFNKQAVAAEDVTNEWQATTPLPYLLASHGSVSVEDSILVVGGSASTGNSHQNLIYSISGLNGSLAPWISNGLFPNAPIWHSVVKNDDNIYVLGGREENIGSANDFIKKTFIGRIEKGSVSSWLEQTPLPVKLGMGASVIYNDHVYYAGGFNGSEASNKVFFAAIDSDGNIGEWQETVDLPIGVFGLSMVEHAGRLYVIGGYSGSYHKEVYSAPINSDGTILNWVPELSFPHALYRSSVVKIGNTIVAIGGENGGASTKEIYYTQILPNGSLEPWVLSQNELPSEVHGGSVVILGKFLYLVGGYSTYHGYLNSVYVTELNVDSSPGEIDLQVPKFMQTDSAWGSHIYDSAHLWSPTTPTISAWGCAMTSAAMVFNYHKITKLPNNEELNPGNLNGWLKAQPDGYVGSGWVNWLALSRLSKQAKSKNPQFNYDALEFKRVNGFNPVQLKTDLENSIPGILEVPGHFIVANGALGDSFSIRDPFYSDRNSLSSYSDTFLTLNRFVPSNTDLSYMMFLIEDEMTIVVKDDAGNVIGEGFTQQPLDEDGGDKKSGKPMYVYYVPQPIDGKYSVEILGNGLYNLESYIYDKNGEVKKVAHAGVTTNSSPDTLVIDFDKDDVSQIKSSEVVTFKNLLADLDFFYKIKTIKNQGIYIALREKVVKAEKYEKKSKIVSKNLMLAFLLELNGVPKALITNDARSILKLQSQILYDSL